MSRDYYEILGVEKEADQEDIKRAYRQKAMLFHPDVNASKEALEQFQELREAYEVLGNENTRSEYDSDKVIIHFPPEEHEMEREEERQDWNISSRYDPANRPYVEMDYPIYARATTIIGIVTFLFALSFLIDFLFHHTYSNEKVESVQLKSVVTQNPTHSDYLRVTTTHLQFDVREGLEALISGQNLMVRKSIIYGNTSFKPMDQPSFIAVDGMARTIYGTACLVYLFALGAVFNKKRPERKFNSAIVACFLSVALILFLFL